MDPVKLLSQFSTATLHEAMGKKGNLPSAIKPIEKGMKVCGPAYTVQTMPRDNVLLHRAYAYANKGDVLIAHCSGFYEAGYWGDLMSPWCENKGPGGLVIDGCVRDADDIETMGFPVFSRGLCIQGTSNHGDGTLNEPIIIGDCLIRPGDIVVGDRDGVVIIPIEKVDDTIEKAMAREAKEEDVQQAIKGRKNLNPDIWMGPKI